MFQEIDDQSLIGRGRFTDCSADRQLKLAIEDLGSRVCEGRRELNR